MPSYGIQPSFAGGEFAPSLHARVDLQKYATGLKTAKNFFVHPHGGASNRPGFLYIATSKTTGKRIRLVPFEFSTEQAYVIEFGEGYCRFYKDGGQIQVTSASAWITLTPYVVGNYVSQAGTIYYCVVAHTSGTFATDLTAVKWVAQTIYEIPNGYTEAELSELKFAQSADILYICHPDHAPRQLERSGHTSWTMTDYDFSGGPFMSSNASTKTLTPSAKTGSITLTASAAQFHTNMIGALYRIIQDVPGASIAQAFVATGQSSSIQAGSTWRIITHGTWTAKFKIEQSVDNGSNWTELRSFSGTADFNANTFGEVDENCLIRINVTSWTSGTLNVDLTSDPYEHRGIVEITAYTNTTTVTALVIQTLGATTATADWAEGSWSTHRGWPSCCTFFEDRLCFASTPTEPQTIWMTETGLYNSFARSEPLVDSDGITINIPSRKMNAIRSMLPLKNILALTAASEWTIGAGADGVLSPTSVASEVNGYRGCNNAEPCIVGNQAIFVQPKGSVVRDLGYDYNSQGFTGANISIISNHFFTNHEILSMCYQQEPDSLVWAVRDDGMLLSMTYLREHEVIAWTQHETDGTVESICSIPGDTYDEVWVSVKRGTQRFVELLSERMTSTDPRRQIFLDACISYNSPKLITAISHASPAVVTSVAHGYSNGDEIDILDVVGTIVDEDDGDTLGDYMNGQRFTITDITADTYRLEDEDGDPVSTLAYTAYESGGETREVVTSITGLSHLEGRVVSILADGNVEVPKTVSSGAITLDSPASFVHVGLPYDCDFETLNVELGLKDGTTQGRKVRVSEVTIRFLNSRGGFVGPDSTDLHEIIQRTDEPLGSPVALFSGDHRMNIGANWDTGGRIFYRQEDPLPVTILAVMPIVTVGG